jgi:TPR repeat protein
VRSALFKSSACICLLLSSAQSWAETRSLTPSDLAKSLTLKYVALQCHLIAPEVYDYYESGVRSWIAIKLDGSLADQAVSGAKRSAQDIFNTVTSGPGGLSCDELSVDLLDHVQSANAAFADRLFDAPKAAPPEGANTTDIFETAADAGDVKAQYLLAWSYLDGVGKNKDTAAGIKWLEKAGRGGLVAAQLDLASAFERGVMVPRDYAVSNYWLQKAIAQGSLAAKASFGDNLLNGKGIDRDIDRGEKILLDAATEGDVVAQFKLAAHYSKDSETCLDAAYWWRKNVAEPTWGRLAKLKLGLILARASWECPGIQGNEVEGVELLRQLSESGDTAARTALAKSYLFGIGVDRSQNEAIRLYEISAREGDGDAQYELGKIYRDGNGVSQNYAQAYYWFGVASKSKFASYQLRERDLASAKLTESERAEVDQQLSEWSIPNAFDELMAGRQ